jgi:hypothetical protein
LAFSCRERALFAIIKTNDLAREAASCNTGLGGTGLMKFDHQIR